VHFRGKEDAMAWIQRSIKWIMVISGALTCTMIYAAVAPEAALRSSFGQSLTGPVADVVVRNWGILIALVGAMLVYGAFRPHLRRFTLTVAAVSKAAFVALVLSNGSLFLAHQAGIAVAVDTIMILLYAWFLIASRTAVPAPASGAN
jgi:hypothetical protein